MMEEKSSKSEDKNDIPISAIKRECRSFFSVNQFVVDDFGCPVSDVVHPPDPYHLFSCLEFFRHALTHRHLFYQPGKQFLSLSVNVGKVAVQLAIGEQIVIQNTVMLFQVLPAPLSLNADFQFFLGG